MEPDFGAFGGTFAAMQTVFSVAFVLIAAVILFVIVKGVSRYARNQAAPEVGAVANVIDKRIATSGGGDTVVSQTHFVTFEQASGERFELQVPASEYGMLAVGDQGTVAMKGTRYLGFTREILR